MLLAATGLLVLAACSGPNKALVDSCIADGMDKSTCECLATEAEKQMDEDVFGAVVLMAEGKEEEANAMMEQMPIEKRFSVATGMISVMGACAVEE
jgi:hypothetical protein